MRELSHARVWERLDRVFWQRVATTPHPTLSSFGPVDRQSERESPLSLPAPCMPPGCIRLPATSLPAAPLPVGSNLPPTSDQSQRRPFPRVRAPPPSPQQDRLRGSGA